MTDNNDFDDFDIGIRGSTYGSYQKANPRALLRKVQEQYPHLDRKQLIPYIKAEFKKEENEEECDEALIQWIITTLNAQDTSRRRRQARTQASKVNKQKAKVFETKLAIATTLFPDGLNTIQQGKKIGDFTMEDVTREAKRGDIWNVILAQYHDKLQSGKSLFNIFQNDDALRVFILRNG